jgi:hypothetical protein
MRFANCRACRAVGEVLSHGNPTRAGDVGLNKTDTHKRSRRRARSARFLSPHCLADEASALEFRWAAAACGARTGREVIVRRRLAELLGQTKHTCIYLTRQNILFLQNEKNSTFFIQGFGIVTSKEK